MGPSGASTACATGEWATAERLADAVAAGHSLPELPSPVPLERGEVLHANGSAAVWRYHGLQVAYEYHRLLATGGLLSFGVIAAATAIGNRRARLEAERLAEPQWRPQGDVTVLATSHRLFVLNDRAWGSVWYQGIRQIRPVLTEERLELFFKDDSPYALHGQWVPYLTVVLATAFAERFGVTAAASVILQPEFDQHHVTL